MTDQEFEELVARGIEELRPEVRAHMKNIAIIVADRPTEEQLREQGIPSGETLFGLYEGIPLSERGIDEPLLPDTVTIFKEPILAEYSDPNEIAQCVSNTVWHEVAHHFGYDEEWVAAEEARRGKTL